MVNLAFDSSDLIGFLFLRMALIGLGVILLAAVLVVVIVMLRRRGKLDKARRYVEPMARDWAERGGTVRRGTTKAMMRYIDKDSDKDDERHR
ncbi:hypothetical protein [Actinocrispum wychmicini]|uniref:Uncharacterized protein n=1 Tax=Actinocrispum wychmicini TaxID=1213861 RepID=A0A4R2IZS7_9PSEU|nr:hypothetical protein [Actinocrispum wychmicini]TCO50917.1 hypothetical protein EV192_113300 [Actinocrispum wychmicini]